MILGFICKITLKILSECEANLKNTSRYKSVAWPEGGGVLMEENLLVANRGDCIIVAHPGRSMRGTGGGSRLTQSPGSPLAHLPVITH
jgi:hypothetical protein